MFKLNIYNKNHVTTYSANSLSDVITNLPLATLGTDFSLYLMDINNNIHILDSLQYYTYTISIVDKTESASMGAETLTNSSLYDLIHYYKKLLLSKGNKTSELHVLINQHDIKKQLINTVSIVDHIKGK